VALAILALFFIYDREATVLIQGPLVDAPAGRLVVSTASLACNLKSTYFWLVQVNFGRLLYHIVEGHQEKVGKGSSEVGAIEVCGSLNSSACLGLLHHVHFVALRTENLNPAIS